MGRAIGLPDTAVLVEQDRVRQLERLATLAILLDAGALLAGRTRIDGEPHHALLGMASRGIDQGAFGVTLFDEWALGVEPFQHDHGAAIARELDLVAVDIT